MTGKAVLALLCVAVLTAGCTQDTRKLEEWEKKTPKEWTEILRHRNHQARQQAVDALIEYGSRAVPGLIEVLEDEKSGGSRLSAARALGGIGSDAEAAVPALIAALADSNWKDRDGAAEALGDISREPFKTIPALIKAVRNDSDERVRGKASRALGLIGNDHEVVISTLADGLEDEDFNVRAEAAEALQRFGPKAKAAIPALQKAAKSEQFIVSQAASEALKAVKGR